MSGQTTGGVRWMLRTEGLCVLLAALLFYPTLGFGWSTFAWFFLLPDLSLLGYLAGPKVGAVLYNAAHSYVGAMACLAGGAVFALPVLSCAGVIWCAHIGFDRALGYGLKYATAFRITHLGVIGKQAGTSDNSSFKQEA